MCGVPFLGSLCLLVWMVVWELEPPDFVESQGDVACPSKQQEKGYLQNKTPTLVDLPRSFVSFVCTLVSLLCLLALHCLLCFACFCVYWFACLLACCSAPCVLLLVLHERQNLDQLGALTNNTESAELTVLGHGPRGSRRIGRFLIPFD